MARFVLTSVVLIIFFGVAIPCRAMEDPQTAERIWSTPNLEKIRKNYKGPLLSQDEAGETKILITFLLHPDGHVQHVKAVQESGDSRSRCDIATDKFKAIKKALVDAIKGSAPLTYRKRPHEALVPWGVLFVYSPKEYSFGRMIHVARGKDRL